METGIEHFVECVVDEAYECDADGVEKLRGCTTVAELTDTMANIFAGEDGAAMIAAVVQAGVELAGDAVYMSALLD